jgi:PHD/YefM family antitoxin component YafN of YafNO toxin-antitoxin module
MLTVNPQYITDNAGKKISVILGMKEFKSLMEELEELEDLRLYDAAKMSNEPSIPIEEAFKMIEEKRKKR